MRILHLATMLLITQLAISQTLNIEIPENHFGLDNDISLVLSLLDSSEDYSDLSGFTEVIISLNGDDYTFDSVPNSIDYSTSYTISNSTDQFTLYFTELPIIDIRSDNEIVDEPKVLAEFIYADEEQVLVSNIGIELRGRFSQTFPKKTYDLEFWEDEIGDETQNVQFKDLRSDDDWILDAIYNEPLRLRSHISHKLWLDIHTLYYQEEEPEAKSGADVEYVEVFLNGKYNGLYNLSEQVDRKQLKLKKLNDEGEIRGELYQGEKELASTLFDSLIPFDNTSPLWGGYELKHPDEDDIIDWGNIYNFTDFVINSSNDEFNAGIWDEFNKDNYVDYFIFLNLLRAQDNRGKNIYTAKYNTDEPYFYVAWDLDGVFGTSFAGEVRNRTEDILTNGFIDRVIELNPGNYNACVSDRWSELRSSIIKTERLIELFEDQYAYLNDYKLYERESLVYPNYDYSQEDLNYLLTWLDERLCFLDSYFDYTEPCVFTPLFDISSVPTCATPGDVFTTTLAYNYEGKVPASIEEVIVTSDSDDGFEILSYGPTDIQRGYNEITVSVVYDGNCSASNIFVCDVVGGGGAEACSQLVSSPIPCCCGDADTDEDGVFNDCDNCPTTPNPDQADSNNNGIGDVCDGSTQFVTYPNPTKGSIQISTTNFTRPLDLPNPKYNMVLFDSFGRKVIDKHVEENETTLETDGLLPGTYLLMIRDENNNFVGQESIMILN